MRRGAPFRSYFLAYRRDIGLGEERKRKEQDLDNLGGKYKHYKFEI